MSLRVLVQIRPDHLTRPGGDTFHAERTARELRSVGVDARVDGAWAPDLSAYDLVHLFNTQLIEPTVHHGLRARGWGLPIVLSPIYWDTSPLRPPGADAQQEALQDIALRLADRVLPNSQIETDLLAAKFPHVVPRASVVYNAAEALFADGVGRRFCERHGLEERGFVLCAARKERRKNQLPLIAACRALGLPLVLAGAETPEVEYVEACRLAAEGADPPVLFLPTLDDGELADAYAAARVHVLPSLQDSVGLSTLEAALGGCNVVHTSNSGMVEYLGDAAWYCDPESVESIRGAIAAAWNAPLGDDLRRLVGERYTWRRAAEDTRRAYEAVIEERGRRDGPPLPLPEYAEHLEELLELQLETIAARDEQFAALESQARELQAQAERLQAQAERLNAHVAHVERTLAERDAALAAARAQVAEIEATRLFRYARPLRTAYARARGVVRRSTG